ncbi:hypothetical protein Maes01_01601 [Microbulbifer aestuariivivens]|uniref:Colanic acid biosynthesis glycosyltransferase WcaI n=1 Tax=Microbulbifer aestuariivivens TaxID=1908308 RepID=A0ABP9WSD8_9GAMM
MKILLYGLNFTPELTGIGKYNGELVSGVKFRDVDVDVVTAPPYYPEWKIKQGFSNFWGKNSIDEVMIYRCPLYVPRKVTTFSRLVHLVSFAISSGLRLLTLVGKRPDIIFLVQPTLFCAPAALIYSRLTGAKSVLHIQDFEVDAMFGLGMGSKDGSLRKFVRRVESWLMRRFDMVSTISHSMLANAERKGVPQGRLTFFPNWSDTDFVNPSVSGKALRDEWGIPLDDKVILYSGNIGAKQGLEIVLDAAEIFLTRKGVRFAIVGAGAYLERLKKAVLDRKLSNVCFRELLPWERVPEMLAAADVHLVVQKRGAADAVLPSKLTNILSAGGHALVTADPTTELGKLHGKYSGIYELVEPENTEAFVAGLERCLAKDTTKPNMVARQYALDYLNKEQIINRFVSDLKRLTQENKVRDDVYET